MGPGGSGVQGHFCLQTELEVSLNYVRPLHKTQQECEKKNLEYKLAMERERERERDEEERQRSLMLAVPQDWRKPAFPKLILREALRAWKHNKHSPWRSLSVTQAGAIYLACGSGQRIS